MTASEVYIGESVHEDEDEREREDEDKDEHEDDHHRNLFIYCLAIVPLLALSIILPNMCYLFLRRHRSSADRQRKLD